MTTTTVVAIRSALTKADLTTEGEATIRIAPIIKEMEIITAGATTTEVAATSEGTMMTVMVATTTTTEGEVDHPQTAEETIGLSTRGVITKLIEEAAAESALTLIEKTLEVDSAAVTISEAAMVATSVEATMEATSEVEIDQAATSKSSEEEAEVAVGASAAAASEEAAAAEAGKMMMFLLTTPSMQTRSPKQAHNLLLPMDKDMAHLQEDILVVATNRLLNNSVDLIITVAHMLKVMAAMTMRQIAITNQAKIKLEIPLII